jgi:hypothetical protein
MSLGQGQMVQALTQASPRTNQDLNHQSPAKCRPQQLKSHQEAGPKEKRKRKKKRKKKKEG